MSNVLTAARDHLLAHLDAFDAGTEPAWLAGLRADAKGAFADAGLPGPKLEEWRYTNVSALAKQHFTLPTGDDASPVDAGAFALLDGPRFVFVDGALAAPLSSDRDLPGGASVTGLRALRRKDGAVLEGHLGALATPKQNAFADLNTAFLDDGAVVHVPRNADLAEPIHLVFAATGQAPEMIHPRVLVVAEAGSRVRVIVDHVALAPEGLTNAVCEVHAGANASVDLVLLQREPAGRFHVSNLLARLERDSRVSTHTLCLGGAWTRNDASVLLAEEGAACTMNGLFLAGGDGFVDNHTLVDHAVPHCTSDELYKGILGGSARGVFRGRVIVRPDAQKTRATQQNPNLLVGRKAEIDTKPQLEIYADDVKCSHGSTVGQLSQDALFYLRSRGLPEAQARDLLTGAFAVEILEALPVDGLADALQDLLAERLRNARLEETS